MNVNVSEKFKELTELLSFVEPKRNIKKFAVLMCLVRCWK